jgi:hypothetical protein
MTLKLTLSGTLRSAQTFLTAFVLYLKPLSGDQASYATSRPGVDQIARFDA